MKQPIRKSVAEANNIDTTKYEYTLVVDGSSVLKTSLVSNKLNSEGKEYGAIEVFFKIIKNVLVKRDFSKCYVFFDDDKSGQLRANIYPLYKANRDKNYDKPDLSEYDKKLNDYVSKVLSYSKAKKQGQKVNRGETDDERYERSRSIILSMCEELFIRTYMSKYVEADDLCAYVVKHRKPNEKICIISGDRDLTQLICEDVCLYVLQTKSFVTAENSVEKLGYTHENVVLKKIFCGDVSDNIKGIKGCGEKTFFDLFPKAKTTKMSVDDIISEAKLINEERVKEKKKPLTCCTHIINCDTDGIQGTELYQINEKIISLEKPLLTNEAEEFMEVLTTSPLDPDGRDMRNLYQIIMAQKIESLYDTKNFSDLFDAYGALIYREKHSK